jgi:hypothetical protein
MVRYYTTTIIPDYKKQKNYSKLKIYRIYTKKPLGQLDDELFSAKVTNPQTNTFYKISDLPGARQTGTILIWGTVMVRYIT